MSFFINIPTQIEKIWRIWDNKIMQEAFFQKVQKNVGDGFNEETICIYIRSTIMRYLLYHGNVWAGNIFISIIKALSEGRF